MTEELKQKAEEFCLKIKHDDGEIWYGLEDIEPMLIDFATEATKELQEELKKWKDEWQEQIEKMKCCFNCKHSRTEYEHCRTNKHEKWELAE